MTYHCPLFTRNVLKVRLNCEKNFQKKRKIISKKITVREKKSRSGMNIYPWEKEKEKKKKEVKKKEKKREEKLKEKRRIFTFLMNSGPYFVLLEEEE